MRVKEKSERGGLNIERTKIMASGPMTSRRTEGEKMKAVTDFLFLGSQISVGGDRSHEIRRWLLLGRKTMTNLDCVKRQRHHLANIHIVKAMVFPVDMYRYKS